MANYLSIVIPAYKCSDALSKNLPGFIDHLKSLGLEHEIIIVDDGSMDDNATRAVAEKYGCRFEENPVNQGKGAAVKRGMKAATGKFRIFTDGDIPYEYEAIKTMLYYLDEKEFDMVVGDRKLRRSLYYDDVTRSRNWASKVFSWMVGLFIVGGWYDTQCGIKGFRSEAAETLFGLSRINGFAMDVEIFYLALKRDYDIKRISVKLRSTDGNSVRMIRHGMMMTFDLFRIWFYQVTRRYK